MFTANSHIFVDFIKGVPVWSLKNKPPASTKTSRTRLEKTWVTLSRSFITSMAESASHCTIQYHRICLQSCILLRSCLNL